MATFTNTVSDDPTWYEQLGLKVLNGGIDYGMDALKKSTGGGNNNQEIQRYDAQPAESQLQAVAQQTAEQVARQQMLQPAQKESGIMGIVQSVSPLVWGGVGAGLTYFLSKSPIASALVGGGLWFFTDNMKKKQPIEINKIPLRS